RQRSGCDAAEREPDAKMRFQEKSGCEQPASGLASVERSAFPPVGRWLLSDPASSRRHIAVLAELPQLFGCAGVLEKILIGLECIEVTRAEPVNGVPRPADQPGQLGFVVGPHGLVRGPTLRLAGHDHEASHPDARALPPDSPRSRRSDATGGSKRS